MDRYNAEADMPGGGSDLEALKMRERQLQQEKWDREQREHQAWERAQRQRRIEADDAERRARYPELYSAPHSHGPDWVSIAFMIGAAVVSVVGLWLVYKIGLFLRWEGWGLPVPPQFLLPWER
ncbi:hypothetical protein [Nonomuraea sp. NPDC050783]|uniref:hypothetical protein n=1 Tax=Nonomuraea sp. NPDC050783 TaxID=3154634 RepID=UPI003465B66C